MSNHDSFQYKNIVLPVIIAVIVIQKSLVRDQVPDTGQNRLGLAKLSWPAPGTLDRTYLDIYILCRYTLPLYLALA